MRISLLTLVLSFTTALITEGLAQTINVAPAGTASQSTTGFGGVAGRANDGNTNGVYGGGSVSHTNTGDANPAWEVELTVTVEISRIVLWNRTDCCSQRLSNFRVLVLDAGRVVVFSNDYFTDMTFPAVSFGIDLPAGTSGKIVRIEIIGPNADGQRWLSLAEVEVFAPLSSLPPIITQQPQGGRAPVTGSFIFQVAAANADTFQWQKDGEDIPGARFSQLVLTGLDFDDAGTYTVVLSNRNGETTSQPAVLVVTLVNVALRGIATQSTTGFGGEASRGNDGNTNGIFGGNSVTHTAAGDANPTWEVDLQNSYVITSIVLWNRTDACCVQRLSNFRVLVLDADRQEVFSADYFTDMTFPATPDFEITLPENTSGRIVRVEIIGPNGDGDRWLSLAEVEVFTEPMIAAVPTLTLWATMALIGLALAAGAILLRRHPVAVAGRAIS